MPTTTLGLRYPLGTDAPNVPLRLQHLAEDVDARLVKAFTTAQRDAFTADLRWPGRVIWNVTTGQLERWDETANAGAGGWVHATPSAFVDRAVSTRLGADAQTRWEARPNGTHAWSDGAAAHDTFLYRNGAGVLQLDGAALRTPGGTFAAPAVAPSSDPDSGMYSHAADVLAFAVGGAAAALRIARLASGQRQLQAGWWGSAAEPTWSWVGDENTGVYRGGEDEMAFASGGVYRMLVANNRIITRVPHRRRVLEWSTLNQGATVTLDAGIHQGIVAGLDPSMTVNITWPAMNSDEELTVYIWAMNLYGAGVNRTVTVNGLNGLNGSNPLNIDGTKHGLFRVTRWREGHNGTWRVTGESKVF